MFGGIAYLVNRNMCVAENHDDLIIRYDPKSEAKTKSNKHVRPFNITGRPMKGWAHVNSEGLKRTSLKTWFDLSFKFAELLPPKK